MPKVMNIPSYDAFMNPLLQSLKSLGGSGTIEEINAKVIEAETQLKELPAKQGHVCAGMYGLPCTSAVRGCLR